MRCEAKRSSTRCAQVIDIAFDSARRSTYELGGLVPALAEVPLEVHASYSREEILAALGFASLRRTPSTMREGVAWCEAANADAFLITLKKSDRDYSPTTMYRDFALSPDVVSLGVAVDHFVGLTDRAAIHPSSRTRFSHLAFRAAGKDQCAWYVAVRIPGSGRLRLARRGPADGDHLAAASADADRGLPGVDSGRGMSIIQPSQAHIVLVTCVESKLSRPAAAKDLYTSPLFRKNVHMPNARECRGSFCRLSMDWSRPTSGWLRISAIWLTPRHTKAGVVGWARVLTSAR